MEATLLDAVREDELRRAALTYPEVGQTQGETLPSGYDWLERTATLTGTDFLAASQALLAWQVQLNAGVGVEASALHVVADAVVTLRLGIGPLRVGAPCRIVYVVDEPWRRGFAYGTLPGHPESGEELFLLQVAPTGGVTLTIRAFSRPSSRLAKLATPVARSMQRTVTGRYLRSLSR
ncbi:DUF1990 domain-containing protein [Jatrophihabitans telluris]|uniref:DUF1990 domain-containing protein n=1 Tax=Jatrophihabitans telluris TaxID=2038343 RepID=A0ABY4QSZ8_9ACTN|nr:DUF1990 domain-containing protein [Jatrophihabitans telluris]UQX86883.1 DUF1990 domain-containing protein [Jatrophihabitans telluris]